MKTVSCCSVRVKELSRISPKAVRIETFDGRSDIFPISQIFGVDAESSKSEAYWIAEWILKQKSIQWSHRKKAMVSADDSGNILTPPSRTFSETVHIPKSIEPVTSNEIDALRKPSRSL